MGEAELAALRPLLVTALERAGVPVAPEELQWETSLSHDLGVDSFALVQLARHVEEAFDLRFTLLDWVLAEQEHMDPTYTLGSLVTFIHTQEAAPDHVG